MASASLVKFLKGRSLMFWVAFSLCVLALLMRVIEIVATRYVQGHWESYRAEVTGDRIRSVQDNFSSYQQETYREAERFASLTPLLAELASSVPSTRNVFEILKDQGIPEETSVEIYDHQNQLLGWWGQTERLQHAKVD